ncbi:phage terminase large subunit [Zooshikella sp. RANM57]|uniref:phage terminase large subunit n=1 Tax=Zooshikella sp. RANM57 TaxID=3425863 RepID=UPI003D700A89
MTKKEKELEHKLKTNFVFFLAILWKYLRLPTPTPIQKDIAAYLQAGPNRKIIMGFRGVAKSWITSAYVLWRLFQNPQIKILVVSASKPRANHFAVFMKRLINDIPFLNVLKPGRNQRDSNLAFDVGPAVPDQQPSVTTAGITGQIVGSRADIIIADDVEVANNVITQDRRDKLIHSVKDFESILKPLPTSEITFLGTPQTEMSMYNKLREDSGYDVRVWPALYPAPEDFDNWKDSLAPFITDAVLRNDKLVGHSTEPTRFTDAELRVRRVSTGENTFAMQFMLDTRLGDADRYPLKLADFIVMSLDPRRAPIDLSWSTSETVDVPTIGLDGDRFYHPMWRAEETAEYTGTMMFIDPSGRGADETGYAVVKFLHGFLYLMDAGGFQKGYDEETLQGLADIAKQHRVNYIKVEDNFGDGMFTALLKPYLRKTHDCQIENERSSGQKELRIIDSLEPVLNQHRLVVSQQLIEKDYQETQGREKYSLFYQLTRLTKDRGALKHDDRLEAVSGAVRYWVEQMSMDSKKEAENVRQELLEDEFAKADDLLLFGFKNERRTWVS